MGHRKNRKRERRREQQGELQWRRQPQVTEEDFLKPDPFSLLEMARLRDPFGPGAETTRTCGRCREFVEDHEGGRGTCLHPGSGVLNPWTDTEACDFFARGRAMNRR